MVKRRTRSMGQLVGQPRRRRSGPGPFAPVGDTSDKLESVIAYRSTRRTRTTRSWIPSDYAGLPVDRRDALLAEFQHYAVVDDLEEDASSGTVVLTITPWPGIDLQGRLRFGRTPRGVRDEEIFAQEADAIGTFINRFRCRLSEDGFPVAGFAGVDKVLQDRPIRIGDAFAMNDASLAALRGEEPKDPVLLFDISRSARELAKISYYAAAAGVLDASSNEELARLAWEEPGLEDTASE